MSMAWFVPYIIDTKTLSGMELIALVDICKETRYIKK